MHERYHISAFDVIGCAFSDRCMHAAFDALTGIVDRAQGMYSTVDDRMK